MNTKSANGVFALLLCICFALLVVTTNISLCLHSGHVHDVNGIGGSCAMCANIASLEKLIKNLVNGCFLLFTFLSLLVLIYCFYFRTIRRAVLALPVCLKVRLNN